MRSRYVAFALGQAGYLYDTLSPDHEDREVSRDVYIAEHLQTKRAFRYPGVRILKTEEQGEEGRVLFHARIFLAGTDHSFVELSTFRRHGDRWAYQSGLLLPWKGTTPPPETLDAFQLAFDQLVPPP